jgi:hypothetical protein
LQESATELEAVLKEDLADLPAPLLERTGKELDRVIGMIRKSGDGIVKQEEASVKLPHDLIASLQDLMGKLEEYDSEAEDVLLAILDQVKGSPVHSMLQGVKKQIGGYDLEAAAEDLEPLIAEVQSMMADDSSA